MRERERKRHTGGPARRPVQHGRRFTHTRFLSLADNRAISPHSPRRRVPSLPPAIARVRSPLPRRSAQPLFLLSAFLSLARRGHSGFFFFFSDLSLRFTRPIAPSRSLCTSASARVYAVSYDILRPPSLRPRSLALVIPGLVPSLSRARLVSGKPPLFLCLSSFLPHAPFHRGFTH